MPSGLKTEEEERKRPERVDKAEQKKKVDDEDRPMFRVAGSRPP